jgi:hypothetical protein
MERVLLRLGLLGCGVALASTVVSVASTTGNLPSWLFGRAQLFASFSRLAGVPVEFVIAAAFGAVALIVWSLSRREDANPYGLAFVFAFLLLATTLTLANGRRQCVALWIMSGCAAGMLLTSAAADRRSLRQTLVNVFGDVRGSVADSRVLFAAAAYVLAFLVVGQSISHRLSAATPTESGSLNLVRWFDQQTPLDLPELRAVNGRRLVIFTDYQCPSCSLMVPQYRSVVSDDRSSWRFVISPWSRSATARCPRRCTPRRVRRRRPSGCSWRKRHNARSSSRHGCMANEGSCQWTS